MWVSQQGCPTISHGRDPPHVWSTQMAPGKHVLCNLQSSGARPWKSKPVPVEGPSLPRAPPPSTSGAPGQLAGRAQQSASASMHLLGSPAGVGRVRRPITGLCEHVLGFCFFFFSNTSGHWAQVPTPAQKWVYPPGRRAEPTPGAVSNPQDNS